jgi:ABC-type multidrug transport system fused ATPase/permease subunit
VIYKTIQDTTPSLLQLVAVLGYMFWLDAVLAMATLLLAPLVAVLVSLFGARVMAAAERSQQQVSELAALLGEAIGGLPLVRAFAAEPWLQQRFDQEIDLHRRARSRTLRLLALQHPVVGLIEFFSFLLRPLTLTLRLFGNMMGGHVALKVFAGFVVSLGGMAAAGGLGLLGLPGAALSLSLVTALTALEFLVAFLQAFVFAVLTCVYLNDVVNMGDHH